MNRPSIVLSSILAVSAAAGVSGAAANEDRGAVPRSELAPPDILDGLPIGEIAPAKPPISGIDLFPVDDANAWGVRHHEDGSLSIFFCDAKLGNCQTMNWLSKGSQKG